MKLNLQFVSTRSGMGTHLMNYCSLIKKSLCSCIMIKVGKPCLCKINFLKIKGLAYKKDFALSFPEHKFALPFTCVTLWKRGSLQHSFCYVATPYLI